jgi:hypothetical protein
MILIRFPSPELERRALSYLAGRFSFQSWGPGETIVPESALPSLAVEGISFIVEGPAPTEEHTPSARAGPVTSVEGALSVQLPTITDPLEKTLLLREVAERMRRNPIPAAAPRLSREDLHGRR